jgi:hypothetical protein
LPRLRGRSRQWAPASRALAAVASVEPVADHQHLGHPGRSRRARHGRPHPLGLVLGRDQRQDRLPGAPRALDRFGEEAGGAGLMPYWPAGSCWRLPWSAWTRASWPVDGVDRVDAGHRRLTARLSRRAVIQEWPGGPAAGLARRPPGRRCAPRPGRPGGPGTRPGPRRSRCWRRTGRAGRRSSLAWERVGAEASGRLSFRSARKSASWSLVSMSEARWLSSWGMADGVASRSARRRTSSPRRTSAAPASTASSRPKAARSGSAAEGEPVVGEGDLAVDLAPASSRTLRTPSRMPPSTLSVSTSTTDRPLSRSWTSSGRTAAPKLCRRACSCLRATFSRLLLSLSGGPARWCAAGPRRPSWSTVLPTTMPRARARNTATSDTMW